MEFKILLLFRTPPFCRHFIKMENGKQIFRLATLKFDLFICTRMFSLRGRYFVFIVNTISTFSYRGETE